MHLIRLYLFFICLFVLFENSVFTPYYSETVLYSTSDLQKENEDGISVLFYLQKIFPGIFLIFSSSRFLFLFLLLPCFVVLDSNFQYSASYKKISIFSSSTSLYNCLVLFLKSIIVLFSSS